MGKWIDSLDMEWAAKVQQGIRLPAALDRLSNAVYLQSIHEHGGAHQVSYGSALIVTERRRREKEEGLFNPRQPDPENPSLILATSYLADALYSVMDGSTTNAIFLLRDTEAHLRALWKQNGRSVTKPASRT